MSRNKALTQAGAEDAARILIKHFFGRTPRSVEQLTGGRTNYVFEANTKDGPMVIRLAASADSLTGFMKEQWVVARAERAGIPIAEILEVGNDVVPYPYMIQQKTSGTAAINYPGDTKEILTQMGALAARIHSIPTTGFGPVFDWSENMLSKNKTFKEYLSDDLNIDHRIAILERHGGITQRSIRGVRAAIKSLLRWEGKPTLTHGDIRLKNIIVDDQAKISAIIDWEESHSAPALIWDLAIALHDLGLDGKEAFLKGYGITPADYAEVAHHIKALNFLHYAAIIEKSLAKKDKVRLQYYQMRLSGNLDLFSL